MSATKSTLRKYAFPVMMLVIGAAYMTLPSPFDAADVTRSLSVDGESAEVGEVDMEVRRKLVAPYDTSASIKLPAFYSSMADVWEPFGRFDTPFLWAVPRTGSGTFQRLIWWCMGKTVAGRGCMNCNNRVSYFCRLKCSQDKR